MSAKFYPGDSVPITLTGTVAEGQLVLLSGVVATDAATTVAGEAMMAGVSGDTITVCRVGIRRLTNTSAAAITLGLPLCAGAAGAVRAWVAGTDPVASYIGRAWSAASASASVDVALFGV